MDRDNESLRKHLAEKVMGGRFTYPAKCCYIKEGRGVGRLYCPWEPDKDIEQAFMCLDTFDNWGIGKTKNSLYNVVISDIDSNAPHDSLPMAISLACGRATGFEDEQN